MSTATVEQQFIVLLYLSTAGMMIGAVLDFSKAWGKVFHFSRKLFFFIDLFIFLAAALTIFQILFLTNWGEVRLYVFLALFLGVILYYALCSRYFYPFFLKLFKAVKKIALKTSKLKAAWQEYLRKKRIKC